MKRKASDVIIDLESKIEKLIGLSENNKLMLQILSNKINNLQSKLNDNTKNKEISKSADSPIFVEAVDVKKDSNIKYNITKPETTKIDTSDNVGVDTRPHGHRRVSRHEVYTGKNSFSNVEGGFDSPIQVPQKTGVRVINPQINNDDDDGFTEYNKSNIDPNKSIPTVQRVIYEDGKAVFMANISVLSLPNLNEVYKSRTSGLGKWSSTLAPGKYRVLIKHRNRLTKESTEKTFDFIIDGTKNPVELDPIIFNKKS